MIETGEDLLREILQYPLEKIFPNEIPIQNMDKSHGHPDSKIFPKNFSIEIPFRCIPPLQQRDLPKEQNPQHLLDDSRIWISIYHRPERKYNKDQTAPAIASTRRSCTLAHNGLF